VGHRPKQKCPQEKHPEGVQQKALREHMDMGQSHQKSQYENL